MEVDVISVVAPPMMRGEGDVSSRFVEQGLRRDAARWRNALKDVVEKKGLHFCSRNYDWSDIDVKEELPTDVLAYFVYQLDPRIAHEIGELILDGRVHYVLVLSQTVFPVNEDWCQRFKVLPLKARRTKSGILIPEELMDTQGPQALIRFYDMHSYTQGFMKTMLNQLVARKEKLN